MASAQIYAIIRKMTAKNIQVTSNNMNFPANPEAGDKYIGFVSRGPCGTSVKLNGDISEAAKERMQKSSESLQYSYGLANKQANNEAIAIVAVTATITTCGCLAI
ncbi:hypothetical protein B0T18DRAFT_424839 [Schizothecium vesticola]|uniref:Uncharacterized protein n=1 Tax=Schizothecium vesticola TaxID=314040 RepID=A0AA40FAW6_9PEZI|nr:hypothetical protein B0T18DRAFT_424839 [Schizothecium vesticola]